MASALGGALRNVFLVGMGFATLALVSGFWLPSEATERAVESAQARDELPSSPADCERLLMAEMTTIDPEHEPVVAEKQ